MSVSIACYRPKSDKNAEVERLAREHASILRDQQLATDRCPIIVRAKDGTIVEIFEWSSPEAIDRAHGNPQVLELWGRFSDACDYVKLSDLPESHDLFANFEPVN